MDDKDVDTAFHLARGLEAAVDEQSDSMTTLDCAGSEASLDFKENSKCSWNDLDEECLDDSDEETSEEEEVRPPRRKKIRKSNSQSTLCVNDDRSVLS